MSDSLSAAWAARKAARGTSRSCNPETEFTAGHASRDADVAALRAELKEAAAGWAANGVLVGEAQAERDAALAVIVAADASMVETPAGFRSRFWDRTHTILAQSHGDALADHDRTVKAAALADAANDLPFIDRPKNMIVRQQDAAFWLRARAAEYRKAGE